MKQIVLDTDVVLFLFKRDSRLDLYLPHLKDREWLISFMTEAELEQWALVAGWSSQRIEWMRLFRRQVRDCSFFARTRIAVGGSNVIRAKKRAPNRDYQGVGCRHSVVV